MLKYIVSQPAIARCIESRSSRLPTTTSAPMSRSPCARSSSFRTIARTALPCFNSSSVTVRPTAPTRPAAPVTKMGFVMFSSSGLITPRLLRSFGNDYGSTDQTFVLEIVVCLLNCAERITIHEGLDPAQRRQVNYLLQRDSAAVQARHQLRARGLFEEVEGNGATTCADHSQAASP